MTAREYYESMTGDKDPGDQIGHYEWHQRYVRWLEKMVTLLLNQK